LSLYKTTSIEINPIYYYMRKKETTGYSKRKQKKLHRQRLTFLSTVSHELRTPLNG
jgi:signal transduction histidine kinase